ncbi:MAG: hypothetical protein WC603_01305 [Candidatus Paceibacterota bacterium]|jgi:hypothetical protein
MKNLKKYLPSRKFIAFLLIIVIFIALFLGIKGIISLFQNKKTAKNEPVQITVGGLIQKDSNNNGIADWEEYLWGLNPNKNGQENKEFIMSKKEVLANGGDLALFDDSKAITENEILSRELFATIISLQQTGELNEGTIQSISEAIGQKIEAAPIPDIYTQDMLILKQDSQDENANYFTAFTVLAIKYQDEDIGSELTLISQGLGNNDPQALYAARTVASAYRAFGQELIKTPVPYGASSINLSLANNYEKVAQSIEGLSQILSDPIMGMRAIVNYKKYTDAIVADIDRLSVVLK